MSTPVALHSAQSQASRSSSSSSYNAPISEAPMNRAPGEVDALSYQTRDGGEPTAVDLRRVLTNIGRNRIARTCATGEGYATEAEADLLMVLALEGLDQREREEEGLDPETSANSPHPGHGAG